MLFAAFLRDRLRLVGQWISRMQLSLIIAICALTVSLAQFYYGNLLASSELGGFISYFRAEAKEVEERDGGMRFSIDSHIAISLVNSGNRPSALLGLYYGFPPGFDGDCTMLPPFDKEMLGIKGTIIDFNGSFAAYQIPATTVAPGALSIVEANLKIKDVYRAKEDLGRGKPICLVFLALDHRGKLYVTTVLAGLLFIYPSNSGYRTSSKLRSLIDLMPRH